MTDEYRPDGTVAEPPRMDPMGLKLPMVTHRSVSRKAGLRILRLKEHAAALAFHLVLS